MATMFDPALDTLATRMASIGRVPLGYRRNGAPIWPVFGAEDNPPPDGPSKVDPPKPGPPAAPTYPANTSPRDMTVDQRAAYYEEVSKKWEGRAQNSYDLLHSFGVTSADDAKAIKEKLDKHDALEYELKSATEKAVADAEAKAKSEARSATEPVVISAKLDAAAARAGVSEEDLAKAIEFIDTTKFLAADGQVDTAKVQAFVSTIAPVKGNQPKGPSLTGHGPSTPSGSAGRERGLAEARKRFPELADK